MKQARHDFCSGISADGGGGQTGGKQPDRKHDSDGRSKRARDRGVRALYRVRTVNPGECGGSKQEQPNIDRARNDQRPRDINAGGAQENLFVVLGLCMPVLYERRVQINRVWHDGRAQHGRRDQEGADTLEARHHSAENSGGAGRRKDEAREESQGHDHKQRNDDQFERALALAVLDRK